MKINVADKWCSRWARIKDAWESNGILVAKCVTCGKIKDVRELECGHFMSRRHMATRYSELNTNPRGTYCNKWKNGNEAKHARYIDEKHGEGTTERLEMEARKVVKIDTQLISTYYRELVNNTLKARGWEHLKWW